MTRSASADLRSHLEGFTPSMVEYLQLATDAIAYANGGHWTVILIESNSTPKRAPVTVAEVIEQLRLGEFLAGNLDPWAEL